MVKSYKGRGTASSIEGRFSAQRRVRDPGRKDGADAPESIATEVSPERAKTIITKNESPDVPFDFSVNPYRGCEHGCIYCYARPAHAYMDLSPGIDFETRLFFKQDAPALLRRALRTGKYHGHRIALGGNTDVYQPIEHHLQITRRLVAVLLEFEQPFSIVTKSRLVLRDADLLAAAASHELVHVYLSLTTLDDHLKRVMEPRAASALARLRAIERLRAEEVPVGVLVAPVIPFINDNEIESILKAARNAGAISARYLMLRLPHELGSLFDEWLQTHFPQRCNRVMQAIRSMRGGRLNDPRFDTRTRGEGLIADLIAKRFEISARKLGFCGRLPESDVTRRLRKTTPTQLRLF